MDVIRRRVLQLIVAGVTTIGLPVFVFAMGPVSAPQKPSGLASHSNQAVTTCAQSNGPCRMHRRHSLQRRADANMPR